MRKLKAFTKNYLLPYLKQTRKELGLTQEEMAAQLCMSTRSYNDLELGKSGLSATTLLLFLAMLPSDDAILQLIHEFSQSVSDSKREEVA